jgi:hypothetical protein
MVARVSYDEALARLPEGVVARAKVQQPPGIPSQHVPALLGEFFGLATKDRFPAVRAIDNVIEWPALVLTRGHYVVALPGGTVLDPSCNLPRRVEEYSEFFKVWEIVGRVRDALSAARREAIEECIEIAKQSHQDGGECCFEDPDGHRGAMNQCDNIVEKLSSLLARDESGVKP